MQIVINIDEETYNDIKKGKVYTSYRDVPQESVLAIANGIPLPKGHGRLIDVDKIIFNSADFDVYNDYSFAFDTLDYAPTIIEADKAESEE